MGRGTTKCIVYAITICVLYAVIGYLNNRNNSVKGSSQDDTHYIVRVPSALKYVYMVMFVFGIVLFIVFLFFKVKGNASVTMGHLWFSLIFAGIGLLVMVWASRWSVNVNESEIEVHRMFHGKTELSMQNIGNVEIGTKEEITLYDQSGKKVITIDGLSDNYDRFVKSLKTYGKIK